VSAGKNAADRFVKTSKQKDLGGISNTIIHAVPTIPNNYYKVTHWKKMMQSNLQREDTLETLTHFLPSKLCTTYSYAQVKFAKNESGLKKKII
jgi:hypothetical protein